MFVLDEWFIIQGAVNYACIIKYVRYYVPYFRIKLRESKGVPEQLASGKASFQFFFAFHLFGNLDASRSEFLIANVYRKKNC